MRHVDDGTVHAWLDGQVTDRAEAAWIDEHLRWCATCAARVAEERSVVERAHMLLASAAPAAAAPAFDDVAARAAQREAGDVRPAGITRAVQARLLPLGWAASLVLAAGIGWLARGGSVDRPAASIDLTRAAEAPATAPGAAAPPEPDAAAPANSRPGGVPAAGDRRADALPGPSPFAPAAAAPEFSPLREPASDATASRAERQAATPPPPVYTPQEMRARVAAAAGSTAAASREAVVPPAPEAAPPPPVVSTEPGALAAAGAAQAGSRGGVAPLALTQQATTVADADAWRALPRTEAAARSGMALYGLEGMDVVLTAISPDNAAVRTVYRLQSGATIELLQARASAPAAAASAAAQSLARGAAQARAAAVANRTARPPTWSEVRGDVRLSLQTDAIATDVGALAARLTIE